ncbi:MAG TPA: VWA domain-containing protein [Pyrinomonadaceae bacterium]|jgi:VWFA-related protein
MNTRSSLAVVLLLSILAPVVVESQTVFQRPPARQQQQQQREQDESANGEDEVVRISSNLVQVDAVVTDSHGRLVTDLRPEEMEIREDGRPQKITNFSFISTEAGLARTLAVASPSGKSATTAAPAPPALPRRLSPEQVRRTIALVVDDLGTSFESMGFVRKALRQFVEQQMQPDDLVAVIRTSSGIGVMQQFTSDKRQLLAAIERVRWNPQGRSGTSAFAPIESNPLTRTDQESEMAGGPNRGGDVDNEGIDPTNVNDRHLGDELDKFREDVFTVGTLGAINYVVRGLKDLPGRKSLLLISDGLVLFNHDPRRSRNQRIEEQVRRLTDLANRSSVVIYTMDARGLQPLGLTAEDSTANLTTTQVGALLSQRSEGFQISQEGLVYLAQQTGGFSVLNRNDLGAGIKRVVEDQKGYYLIGYRPDESTFDPATGQRRFHKLSIKVVGRPGLKVRYRTGFYGITDREMRPELRTRAEQMINALSSPFSANGVNLRLTSLFGNDPRAGSFIRSLLHIDGRDLTFTTEADGWHKAVFDVLAVTFGDSGQIVDQISRTHTLRVRGSAYERVLKDGFVYFINLPVKQAGAYQLRTALRDTASERIGSANQFIEVPDLAKDRLTISGIVLSGVDPAAVKSGSQPSAAAAVAGAVSSSAPGAESSAEEDSDRLETQSGPAVRRFRQGMMMRYGYMVYNAQLDKATSRPQVQTQIRLFRDDRQVFTGKVQPLSMAHQSDLERLIVTGALKLGTDMTPGEYALQVIVTDPLAKEKYRTATQWIDFEIVK